MHGQLLAVGVLVRDEPLSGSDEVVEDILLQRLGPLAVPLFAILATAAQVYTHIHAALFQERHDQRVKVRRDVDVEATVAVHPGGVVARELKPLAVHDEHRHAGAILARKEHLLHLDAAGVERHLGLAEQRALAGRDVVAVHRGRGVEAVVGVEQEVVLLAATTTTHHPQAWQLHFALQLHG